MRNFFRPHITPANTQPEFPFLTSQTSDFYAYSRSGVKLAPVWRLWPARGVGHWRAASPSGLPRELRRAHPPPLHLGTAPIPSKPTYISPFVAFYQIASSLRKWKSGVIATNTQFSNPTRDWVKGWQPRHVRPTVKLWDHAQLERLLSRHPDVVLRLFSEALSLQGRFQAMESRFWNKLEFVTLKTLAELWKRAKK